MSDRLREAVYAYRAALAAEQKALHLLAVGGDELMKLPAAKCRGAQTPQAELDEYYDAAEALEGMEGVLKACVQARHAAGNEVFAAALAEYPE